MAYNPHNPLIVQSDRTVMLEVDNPLYEECRDQLAAFCELIKSPEHIHTYRITPLSLWNARAAGMTAEDMLQVLQRYSKYEVPGNILHDIRDYVGRYGRLKLLKRDGMLLLQADDNLLMTEIRHTKAVQKYLLRSVDARTVEVPLLERGRLKQALLKLGFPVEDLAGYVDGEPLSFCLREVTRSGKPFLPRPYQEEAADAFWASGSASGGSGVLVLPCGAGKTIIGMQVMARAQMQTLIICTGITAARQWKEELLDKTTLTEDLIGEFSGERKEIRPVTIATYQVLTTRRDPKKARHRKGQEEMALEWEEEDAPAEVLDGYLNLDLFNRQNWGLIIYDEVHLLPAPVFRITAEIQAKRRLGLTATLVREDGREDDVFSLIGPKKADVPWKVLEKQGWIATALCTEIRVPLDERHRLEYALADPREKFRLASINPRKEEIIAFLLDRHREDNVLIIGQYLEQLEALARQSEAPIITGKTPQREREQIYTAFRNGEIKTLIVSKVANFSIDLPDANVAIQISGTFGSRQEEAQRLGRILRPKSDGGMAHFYSLVTRETRDQEFAAHRQLFLTEQGYRYEIIDAESLLMQLPDWSDA
ncbi:MAG: DEAD/DEAH box helicase [Chloroherpetonaceae bacterium]|nr:DEAD/DEAH box helicase [Chthonomonadaceae bacterium]MDW8206233.1 DEAD/DEAH box helicase [Chloroherpetonaceae bacterium]